MARKTGITTNMLGRLVRLRAEYVADQLGGRDMLHGNATAEVVAVYYDTDGTLTFQVVGSTTGQIMDQYPRYLEVVDGKDG